MADDGEWVDVPQASAPSQGDDGWVDVLPATEQPAEQSWWDRGKVRPTTLTSSDVGKVGDLAKVAATAFGHGFEEGFGPERLGLSEKSIAELSKAGVFAPEGAKSYLDTGWRAPFYAMTELLGTAVHYGAMPIEGGFRGLNGIYRGMQQVGLEFGLPKDVVSIPDAFMGSPHPMGVPRVAEVPRIKEALVKGGMEEEAAHKVANFVAHDFGGEPERLVAATVSAGGRVFIGHNHAYAIEEARKAIPGYKPGFDPIHLGNTPTGGFITSYGRVVSREDAYNLVNGDNAIPGGRSTAERQTGLRDPENKALADEWQGKTPDEIADLVNKKFSGPKPSPEELGRAQAIFDKARDEAVNGIDAYHGSPHDFESFDISKLGGRGGGEARGVGFNFADKPEDVQLYRYPFMKVGQADLIGPEYKVRIRADRANLLNWDKPFSEQPKAVQELVEKFDLTKEVDGKYGKQVYDALYNRIFSDITDNIAAKKGIGILDISEADQAAARQATLRELTDAGIPGITHEASGEVPKGVVIFDDKLIDITHKNGEPLTLETARDLGVVGPERPPITEGKPAEAAKRAVAADRAPDEKVTQELEGAPNAWRERFDGFVGKLKTPEDAKELIRNAADENGEFQAAREGDIPLKQVEDLATAAGVEASTVDRTGVGRLLQNDNQVRNAMQAMLTATDNVKTAAREVKLDPSPANLMKLQEAMLRRDTWVEQVVGHRAEWGRTGNVFQEFLTQVKNEESFNQFMKDKDRTPEGLRKIADMVDGLDGSQAARLLNDANKPTFFDKVLWYWVNALISGPVTHAKYIIANAAFGAYESGVVTPIAGTIGAVRRAVTGNREGVFMGEAAARMWGLVAGTPDAILAAAKAGKTGLQTALPGEVAQNIIPKQNKNIAYQQKPIPGAWGTVIGLPSRGASAIHSFFNFLGYRASMEAQAYRAAAKEGLSVKDDAFWERRASAVDKPSVDMMNNAVEEGYRLTYITELGPWMKSVSEMVNTVKPLRLIMPFMHIPFNILRRAVEGTPLAFLDGETRAALSGKAGAVKQDMAAARLIAGGAVGAWAVNLFLNDRISGFGPTERKERDQWLATGHMPYAVRIGDEWFSFNRFGSLGTMLGLYANLAEVIPHMEGHDEGLTKGIAMVIHSTGRLLEDEVGMQGLAGLIEAINEPERKGSRFVASFAGSFLPYSSMQRQVASAMDPHMREAKTFVDGLRYYIPVARQGLIAKRDWLGEPIANAGYGGDIPYVPGASAIIRHQPAGNDPLAFEMQDLDLHPAPPVDRIGGVKLPPKMYDEYQAVAGAFTRQTLEGVIAQDGWENVPKFARQEVIRSTIRTTRQAAAAVIQARNPDLIRKGIEQRMDQIQGRKPTKLEDARQ